MIELYALLLSAICLLGIALALWLTSLRIAKVSLIDSFWSLMILACAVIFFQVGPNPGARGYLVLVLLVIWAIRLSVHITWRNWGQPEDLRYQVIRSNNEPNFQFKSFYIVFALQAFLALLVSLSILGVMSSSTSINWLDYIALTLWSVGMYYEVVGDYQLMRFRSNSENEGKVLNTGVWQSTRHPNYFGEFCIWWAFYCFALAAGGWWSIVSPLLMSVLLLKVSGVAMLEKSINQRRPDYAHYCQSTNAFFPGWSNTSTSHVKN
ncbi:DUF1295 domain-containing protein [Pseudomonadota bacterium]